MARAEGKDRGLYSRINVEGEERWYVRIAVDGRMQTYAPHGGFPSKDEAETFLADTRADLRRGKFFPDQFKAGLRTPLADLLIEPDPPATHASAKNERAYRAFWRDVAGQYDARTLPPNLIDEAKAILEREGKSAQTVHHYLKHLRHVLNVAKRNGLIDRSPFDMVRLAPVHNLRERFYSEAERRKLYKALGPDWCEAAELAGLTGLRWSEQFGLERDRIHVREGYVSLPRTKAGKPQVRLLNKRAREICRRQLARSRSRWLYPNQTGTGPIDYANFRKRVWNPACMAAGIENARWNDWRHTFASDLTMQGHSDRTVADLLGHGSTQMVRRYAHLAPSHRREAIEGLGTANLRRTAKRSRHHSTA